MPEDLILYIRFVYFALEKEKNHYFEQHNLTSSQGDILLFLGGAHYHKVEVNQKNIEEHFHLTNPTVTGLLKRLEEKGFIGRRKSEVDGRHKLINLTDQSMRVLEDFQTHKKKIDQKLLRGIDEEEEQAILVHMKKLLSNLDPEHRHC
ncbi:hypothetical protein GCM10012290_16880 [Halolactibacillus alkaliphilus]|uniref:HTH marR-type domain-containing protein n=1 Tax=Halolactibacillus alkaliphilus TaxID=442899 RepID=A0A511X229_9BACI|nr:MarR family transcriptional regulator [Halolactibacillus alkaliphilus]GEN57005.1 hypothetical protein HAL01_14690 [Halolactibacillus alkaliphilus]GGN71676.1 hypothetical protein GCM10012290_16880 [Halolactibacillus alkaliphilus]SFO85090.1 DNA-binding transcriptional regulator, MarR family [Halolactibacillus alkaliphilus]